MRYSTYTTSKQPSTRQGFTLLELIVSVALFTIVVTIATSAYLKLIELNRKARATNDLVSNLSFVTESIGRSIRTGRDYDCGGIGGSANCWPTGNSTFSFENEDGDTVTYLLKSGGVIGMCVGGSCTNASASPLTDPRITITSLTFYVDGVGTSGTDAAKQPRVIISMSGSITPDTLSAPISFSIQTSATQRIIEI